MRIEITTKNLREADRFAMWREHMLAHVGTDSCPPAPSEQPFHGRLAVRTGGPLVNMVYESQGHRVFRRNRHVAARTWDAYWIYRERAAGAWFSMSGTESATRTGDIVMADADLTFETFPTAGYCHDLWLVPKSLLAPHLPAQARPSIQPLSGQGGAAELAVSYLASLTERWDELPAPVMAPVADTLCRLLGIACGAIAEDQPDAMRAGRLTAAKRLIDRHLADPALSPATIAGMLGISVRSLHLLFEPSGSSFARHVLRRRLDECRAALLAQPLRSVTDIAFAWGFTSLSSFYRAFQTAFDITPSDLRRAAGP